MGKEALIDPDLGEDSEAPSDISQMWRVDMTAGFGMSFVLGGTLHVDQIVGERYTISAK
jgi:hypothetical protein